jgi:PAS domain S-box-containing protein
VFDNQGEVKYIIEHLRDITAIKKSQAELIKSRQRYWDLFNSSAAGILLGSPEGSIVEVNESFCQMTGFKRDELIGMHISQSLFTKESIIKSPFRFDLLKQGKAVSSKRDLMASDGRIIPIEMFTQIMPDGTYQSIYYDLTERHLAEVEINRQNQELKMLNIEKDRLFSIIAHDLRSPFTAILGLTEMISDEFDAMDRNEVKEILKELNKSAGNLYKLLDNLLEWTMVRRNKKPFNPTDISLIDLIKYSIQTLTENARAKSINVYIDVAEDLRVFADRNMLEVIVRNLFSNAVKFTYHDGHITISAEQLSEKVVAVRVSDTGMGMPVEMQGKIFSVSERNNRRGTNGEPSAGLGLLLCKEFVEKNGGEISVNSVEGEGSTFSFTIPICAGERQNT